MLKWVLILGVIFLLIVGGAAMAYAGRAGAKKPSNWKTAKIKTGDLEVTVTATGSVSPRQSVQVGSQISGLVKEVRKGTNDHVTKGEVLALLDTDLLNEDRRLADIGLSQKKAALRMLEVERENLTLREARLKNDRERRRIAVARALDTFNLATKNRKRYEETLNIATSQSDLDTRILEEQNAKHDHESMQVDLLQLDVDEKQIAADRRQLDAREEQSRADVQQAEAALKRADTNIRYATIISPIDGVILEQGVDTGQTIAASYQTPNLFKVASDLSEIQIDAKVDEADIGRIVTGQTVTFQVDAYRGETFTGEVRSIRLQSDAKANLVTYPVLIAAKNPSDEGHPHGKLLPGMTASLRFVLEKRKDVLMLPSSGLHFTPPAGTFTPVDAAATAKELKKGAMRGTVYVAGPDGQLRARAVQLGANDGDSFELLDSDLKAGDRVVTGQKTEAATLDIDAD
jgi:HlyD family secretion protein